MTSSFDVLFSTLLLDFLLQLDAFMGSLNCKGERERALSKQLEKSYSRIW